jgi:small conductance mechanosensitive channel
MPKELDSFERVYDVVAAFLVAYSFQIIASLILLVIGWKLAGILGTRIGRMAARRGIESTLAAFMGMIVRLVALVFVIIITLGNFGISIAPLIAVAGALGLGAAVAIQGPLSNIAAGLVIIFTRPFVVGNTITVRGHSGVVEEVKLSATILTNSDGAKVTIPNRQIVGEILVNSHESQLAETRVRVPYGTPTGQALEVLRDVLSGVPEIANDPAPQVVVEDLGDMGPVLIARYWVSNRNFFEARGKVNASALAAFEKASIKIQPMPTISIGGPKA